MNAIRLAGMDPISDSYSVWLREQLLAPQTIIRRVDFLNRIRREIGDPLTITGDDIAVWLEPWTGWTLASYFAGIKSVMSFLHETGRRADHPMTRMRRPPIPKPRPKPLTDAEVATVLAATTGDHRTWLELALFEGLRSHEIAKVRGEDIREARTFVLGKGAKQADLPTHPRVWEAAQRYPTTGFWFPSPRPAGHISSDWVTTKTSRLFRQLGLEGSIHRLRATYGTRLLRNGVNLKVVQQLMRHETLAATQHYLGVDEDELTSAIGGLDYGQAA